MRQMVGITLTGAGHQVQQANDGREALTQFGKESFDLIITDIIMPEMEGIETVREIRKLSKSVKILAMSGGGRHQNVNFLDAARQLGADEVLEKPFDPRELLNIVNRMIA